MDLFYEHGSKSVLTDIVTGDGEVFYCHVAKWFIPLLVKETFEIFGCGVGIFKMQGFEHRIEQSKFACSNKTNVESNCFFQVVKGLHMKFLNN